MEIDSKRMQLAERVGGTDNLLCEAHIGWRTPTGRSSRFPPVWGCVVDCGLHHQLPSIVPEERILLGRACKSRKQLETDLDTAMGMEDDMRLEDIEEHQGQIVFEWRRKWLAAVIPDMVPRTKWKSTERNIRVGDLGHIQYEQKLGAHTWRVARVVQVKMGEDNVVQTIVSFRPRHITDMGKRYVSKRPETMEIGVQ